MTDYFKGPLLGLDIESSGIDSFEDRIVTYSMVFSPGPDQEPQILEWLINPEVEIPQGATDVHGISTQHARDFGLPARDAILDIYNRLEPIVDLGIPIVIYNAPFDTTMTLAEFYRHGIKMKYSPEEMFAKVIDPLVIDKAVDKYRKGSRKLTDTAKLYGYDLTNAHESTADVLATLHITRQLGKWFKPEMTIEILQEFQKDAKLEQATSLEKYLRSTPDEDGNDRSDLVLNKEWPFQTTKEEHAN